MVADIEKESEDLQEEAGLAAEEEGGQAGWEHMECGPGY